VVGATMSLFEERTMRMSANAAVPVNLATTANGAIVCYHKTSDPSCSPPLYDNTATTGGIRTAAKEYLSDSSYGGDFYDPTKPYSRLLEGGTCNSVTLSCPLTQLSRSEFLPVGNRKTLLWVVLKKEYLITKVVLYGWYSPSGPDNQQKVSLIKWQDPSITAPHTVIGELNNLNNANNQKGEAIFTTPLYLDAIGLNVKRTELYSPNIYNNGKFKSTGI